MEFVCKDGAHIKVLIDNCQQSNFKKVTVWLTLKQLVALLNKNTGFRLFFERSLSYVIFLIR